MKKLIIILALILPVPAFALEMPWQGEDEPGITREYKADHLIVMSACGYVVHDYLENSKADSLFTRWPKMTTALTCLLPMVAKEELIDGHRTNLDHAANVVGVTVGLFLSFRF